MLVLKPMISVWERGKVVGACLLAGLGLSGLAAARIGSAFNWDAGTFLSVWLLPLAGPFAEPWALAEFDPGRMALLGIVFGCMSLSHSCWPNLATAIFSVFGIFVWFFFGFAYTYVGVL